MEKCDDDDDGWIGGDSDWALFESNRAIVNQKIIRAGDRSFFFNFDSLIFVCARN